MSTKNLILLLSNSKGFAVEYICFYMHSNNCRSVNLAPDNTLSVEADYYRVLFKYLLDHYIYLLHKYYTKTQKEKIHVNVIISA